MIKFESLASSSAGCAYKVSAGGSSLLIDAGLPFREILKAFKFRLTADCRGALISHEHQDHARCIPDILKSGIKAYASAPAWSALRDRVPRVCQFFHNAVEIKSHTSYWLGDWHVLPFDAVHDGSGGCLGFMIGHTSEKGSLVYLTDSAYSKHKFEGVAILAIECNHSTAILKRNVHLGVVDIERAKRTMRTHMSLERLLKMLAANDLSKVEEIHLLHLSNENSNEEEFKRAVTRATGIPTFVAAARSH
jgi:phosphoribosyl 1,2-cyclic phosphodiesterase